MPERRNGSDVGICARGDGSISASVEATASRPAPLGRGGRPRLLFYLNLLDRERVGELLGSAIVRELGPP